jgi:hypothetical protein
MRSYPLLEIQCLYILSILYQIAVIKIKPFALKSDNILELVNEISVSLALIFNIVATEIVETDAIRFSAGYGIVTILISTIILNLTLFLYDAYLLMRGRGKILWIKYCRKKNDTVKMQPELTAVNEEETKEGSFISQNTTHNDLLQRAPTPEFESHN